MALTEEHERTARQVAKEINPDRSGDYEVIVIERFLAALPKPEPVGRGWLDPISGKLVCAAPDGPALIYTEAPIAQPASAPSEQKPVATVVSLPSKNARGPKIEWHDGATVKVGMQLFAAPQPDYEAQRDAERLDFLDKNRSMNMGWSCGVAPAGNVSITSVICGKLNIREAIDAAIASVKGGE